MMMLTAHHDDCSMDEFADDGVDHDGNVEDNHDHDGDVEDNDDHMGDVVDDEDAQLTWPLPRVARQLKVSSDLG